MKLIILDIAHTIHSIPKFKEKKITILILLSPSIIFMKKCNSC